MKRYYEIQKALAMFLLVSMALTALAGCAKEEQEMAGTISDYESQTHFQVSAPEDASASGDASKAPASGEFVVSDKKYDYKDANLVLLNVENKTDRHYTVTIKGRYLDENGETIKEESQTYKAFPSGWSNHFVFYPKIAFEKFTYELETEEYQADELLTDENGVPFVSYIELTYERKMEWMFVGNAVDANGNPFEAWDMYFWSTLTNKHPTANLSVEYHVIVLNEQNEIFVTDFDLYDDNGGSLESVSGAFVSSLYSEDNGKRRYPVFLREHAKGEDETIPENVQGVFTAIFAITGVVDFDKYNDQLR